MNDYVFVILRHIGKPLHHQYWEKCYKSIRKFHGNDVLIVIIDDNSKLKAKSINEIMNENENTLIYHTENNLVGKGEILPYIYFLTWKWKPYMICLHDSMELNKAVPCLNHFDDLLLVRFHWFFSTNKHNNVIKINNMLSVLKNPPIHNDDGNGNKNIYCFGGMSTISLKLVELLDQRYNICQSIHPLIKDRSDRMAFERIFGIVCSDYIVESLCGNIFDYPQSFMPNKNPPSDYNGVLIKRWIGR